MKANVSFDAFPNPKNVPVKGKGTAFLIGCFLLTFSFHSYSQNDTAAIKHSPRKAVIMSACLPGLGQIYNKKYWKLPIIYAGAATVTFIAIYNTKYYKEYRDAYIARTDGDSTTIDNFPLYQTDVLLSAKNIYRHNLELTYIIGAGIYLLNIIDAAVDANLFDFNVDDNLSMKISPAVFRSAGNYSPGITVCFNIGHFKTKNLR